MSHIAAMYRTIQINATVRKLQESGTVITLELLSQIEDDVEAKMAEIYEGSGYVEDRESDD
jgi:hypothetical protein